jgi:hypothetical protein
MTLIDKRNNYETLVRFFNVAPVNTIAVCRSKKSMKLDNFIHKPIYHVTERRQAYYKEIINIEGEFRSSLAIAITQACVLRREVVVTQPKDGR